MLVQWHHQAPSTKQNTPPYERPGERIIFRSFGGDIQNSLVPNRSIPLSESKRATAAPNSVHLDGRAAFLRNAVYHAVTGHFVGRVKSASYLYRCVSRILVSPLPKTLRDDLLGGGYRPCDNGCAANMSSGIPRYNFLLPQCQDVDGFDCRIRREMKILGWRARRWHQARPWVTLIVYAKFMCVLLGLRGASSMRIPQPWDVAPACEITSKPSWPFAYSKYKEQQVQY